MERDQLEDHCNHLVCNCLDQGSPTFLAPGTGFVEDSFSTDRGGGGALGMIQAYYIYCAPYFCYYYIVIYNEIIIMQSQWEP